jgi:hypothetical protein
MAKHEIMQIIYKLCAIKMLVFSGGLIELILCLITLPRIAFLRRNSESSVM